MNKIVGYRLFVFDRDSDNILTTETHSNLTIDDIKNMVIRLSYSAMNKKINNNKYSPASLYFNMGSGNNRCSIDYIDSSSSKNIVYSITFVEIEHDNYETRHYRGYVVCMDKNKSCVVISRNNTEIIRISVSDEDYNKYFEKAYDFIDNLAGSALVI